MIDPPRFNDRLGLDQRGELVHVQTLIAETPVKRLNECVFDGFPRSNEIELYASPISPIFQCTRLKFGAMINCDRARPRPIVQDRIEHRTQSTPLIDHGQDLRWTSIIHPKYHARNPYSSVSADQSALGLAQMQGDRFAPARPQYSWAEARRRSAPCPVGWRTCSAWTCFPPAILIPKAERVVRDLLRKRIKLVRYKGRSDQFDFSSRHHSDLQCFEIWLSG